jgi:CubicO group peptidase (beta-lactamase class C family)
VPFLALLLGAFLQATAPAPAAAVADVDAVFAEWTAATPGCSVGVGVDGRPVIEKGFGMADLERGVPNRGDTIFEAGSVSKQFTAAAVLLLSREGRLSLDDPIRRHFPELPEYETPVTIRQMLTHTSGLRDWGSVAGIAGWPRTTRVHTHAHVLDILSRQQALNFPAGTRWSYSNSGYNLAAILVSRVSGMSFAEFTRRRIFEPLGMTRTSWRDDHTRIVPGRALAYDRQDDGYHLEMPFENVHGNGGLLTTVGDLVKWTRNFKSPVVGDAGLVAEQTTPGRFADGQAHDYGLGVWVGEYRGTREIRHSGSTAGYRAYLSLFPETQTTVAVLCNAGNASAEALTYKVVDVVLGPSLTPRTATNGGYVLSEADASALAGLYRNTKTGAPVRIVKAGSGLRVERGATLMAESGTRLVTPAGQRWVFDGRGAVSVTDAFGRVDALARVSPWTPGADDLRAFEGVYASLDAETEVVARVEDGALVLRQRPDRVTRLTPIYEGAFTGALGTAIFRRDQTGRAVAFSVVQDRVWDLPFSRKP